MERQVKIEVCGDEIKIDKESFEKLCELVALTFVRATLPKESMLKTDAGELVMKTTAGVTTLFQMALFDTEKFQEITDTVGISCFSAKMRGDDREELCKQFSEKVKEMLS